MPNILGNPCSHPPAAARTECRGGKTEWRMKEQERGRQMTAYSPTCFRSGNICLSCIRRFIPKIPKRKKAIWSWWRLRASLPNISTNDLGFRVGNLLRAIKRPSRTSFLWARISSAAKVKVIYTSKHGDIIYQYIMFCKILDEQIKLYGYTKKAVQETIWICSSKHILNEYLMHLFQLPN